MDIAVITAPVKQPITLAQAREQCNLCADDTSFDTQLSLAISACTKYGQWITGRQFVEATFRATMDAFPKLSTSKIELKANLNSVTSITYTDTDGETQTWAADQYEVKTDPLVGYVRLAKDCDWPEDVADHGNVTITFKAGWPVVEGAVTTPEDIQAWLLVRVAGLFAQKENFTLGRQEVCQMPRDFVDGMLDFYCIPVVA